MRGEQLLNRATFVMSMVSPEKLTLCNPHAVQSRVMPAAEHTAVGGTNSKSSGSAFRMNVLCIDIHTKSEHSSRYHVPHKCAM